MRGINKDLKSPNHYKAEMQTKNLTYGLSTLPWCDLKNAWIKPNGKPIYTRREAGDYVEKMDRVMRLAGRK